MSTVLKPWATSGDVIRSYVIPISTNPTLQNKTVTLTALALDLDQNGEIGRGLAIPRSEGLKELETVGLRVNGNLNASTVGRGCLVGILTRIEAVGGKLLARWVGELEGLSIAAREPVRDGVECEITGEGHGGYEVRRSNESVSSGVGIITAGEVTVVRGDD